MKKIIFILLAFSILSFQSVKSEDFYIEGQVNYSKIDDIETSTYSDTIDGDVIVGKLTNDYDYDTGYGYEIGIKNVSDSNFRIGYSYGQSKIKLKTLTVSGTINGDAGSESYTPAQLSAVGLNFDNDIKSYSINVYYDLETNRSFTPYVGAGLGEADIQNATDKELLTSVYLGGRHSVNEQMYVGVKGIYSMIDGPTDQLGLSYKDITQTTVSLIVGYNF